MAGIEAIMTPTAMSSCDSLNILSAPSIEAGRGVTMTAVTRAGRMNATTSWTMVASLS